VHDDHQSKSSAVAAPVTQKKFHHALNRSAATWEPENGGGKNKPTPDALPPKTTHHARPVLPHPTSPQLVKAPIELHFISARFRKKGSLLFQAKESHLP
jgi:hypothetical protein